MKTTLEHALQYASHGWHVFPVHGIDKDGQCTCGVPDCIDAGKHPITRRGLKEATTDEAKIRDWWEKHPRWNVAIRTGEISGVTVLDVDIGDGKQGAETWASLTMEKGEPETLVSKTGSGGMHALFKFNSALNTSSNTLGPGIDCRNDGGYIIAAPSRHRSGGVYEWENWPASTGDDVQSPVLANLPAHLSKKVENRGRKKGDKDSKKYSLAAVAEMLTFIPSEDRDMWRNVGVILGREFERSDEAFQAYQNWSDTWQGTKGPKHDQIMKDAFYVESGKPGALSIGSIVHHALKGGWQPTDGKLPPDLFVFYSPGGDYIYRPTAEHWPAASVDSLVSPVNVNGRLIKASDWIRRNIYATSITSDPILEEHVGGYDVKQGVLIENREGSVFNIYSPPRIVSGDAKYAKPWLEHVHKVFDKPGDAQQFLNYMAHRVQKPGEKPRFALLIAGEQGTGKDSMITMCYPAIGEWNCANIKPDAIESTYNEFEARVLINISEAANHGELSKWAFNESMKTIIAGNPDFREINPKFGRKYSVRSHNGTVITTNHLLTGLYIPPGDRRYDVIECATLAEMRLEDQHERGDYFAELWNWYNEHDGAKHIAAYLREYDITGFNASTGQRVTAAHMKVVQTGFSGDDLVIDAFLEMGTEETDFAPPPFFTLHEIKEAVKKIQGDERKANDSMKSLPHAIARQGYQKFNNHKTQDGRWRVRNAQGALKWTVVFYDPRQITPAELAGKIASIRLPEEAF